MNYPLTYRIFSVCLFINNLAGIALNPMLFALSLVFIMGIPGLVFLILYARWAFAKRTRTNPYDILYILPMMILYNLFIHQLTGDLSSSHINGFKMIGPAIFPMLNTILCSIMLPALVTDLVKNRPGIGFRDFITSVAGFFFVISVALTTLYLISKT